MPDVAWPGLRVAVFLDSAWWHGHPSRWTPGRLPPPWDAKIAANRARDEWVTEHLRDQGWTVLRFWDFQVARDVDTLVAEVVASVAQARKG